MSRHFEIQCWKSKPQLTFQRPTPPLSPSQAQPCRRRDPSLRRVRRGHDAGTSCGRRRCRLAVGDVPSTDDKKLANVLISCRPKGNASSHSVKAIRRWCKGVSLAALSTLSWSRRPGETQVTEPLLCNSSALPCLQAGLAAPLLLVLLHAPASRQRERGTNALSFSLSPSLRGEYAAHSV